MSSEPNRERLANGTDVRRQLIQSILSSVSAEDVPSGDVTRLLMEELGKFNYSLTPAEVAIVESLFQTTDLGPKRDSLSTVIPITVVYSLIFITGIIGNVCTCLVIVRNKYMRTVTNCYLFNLSVSDLLLLVLGLPQETYSTWSAYPFIFGNTFCRLRLLSSEASSYVSIMTITAFTFERYVAICHPIVVPTHPGLSRPLRVVLVVWIISTLCAIPVGLQFGIVYKEWRGAPLLDSAQCNTLNPDVAKIVFQVSTFIFFVLPMFVISLLYSLIALAVRKSVLTRAGSYVSPDSSRAHKICDVRKTVVCRHRTRIRRSVLKMLVAVVVAFFVCWMPFHTQRLLAVYVNSWSSVSIAVHNILFYISGVTYYLSAIINPVLYSIMSLKFRQALRSTLLCCFCCTRSRARRPLNKSSYTFKFHRQAQAKTRCSAVDSSNSNSRTDSKKKKNGNENFNQSKPVLCCVVMNRTPVKGRDKDHYLELSACDTLKDCSYQTNSISQSKSTNRLR